MDKSPQTSEWQRIETAPYDETRIIIATRSHIDGMVIASRSAPQKWFYDDYGESYVDATHWQYLPDRPIQGEN